MSVEIVLHPERGTKAELESFLKNLGYEPCEHLWSWPKGSLNFHWFEINEYRSYDGVEATISKPTADEQKKLGKCAWSIHTRTRSSASPDDRSHQNKTIRDARLLFGGSFYNDWHGKNRYTPVEPDGRDAIARGLYLARSQVMHNISFVILSLPEGRQIKREPKTAKQRQIADYLGTSDPTRWRPASAATKDRGRSGLGGRKGAEYDPFSSA